MKNGRYEYALATRMPLGERKGALRFELLDGVFTGTLELLGSENPIEGGRLFDNGALGFAGQISTLLGPLVFTARGEAAESGLQFSMTTLKGVFTVAGQRIGGREQ